MSVPDLTNFGIVAIKTLFTRTIFNDENTDGIDISTQSARLLITAGTTMALTSTNDMLLSSGIFDLEASGNIVIETTNGTLSLLASNATNGKIIIDAEEGIELVTTEQDINIGITTGDLNVSSDKILLKTNSTATDSFFINSLGGIDLTSNVNNIDIITNSGNLNAQITGVIDIDSLNGSLNLGSTSSMNMVSSTLMKLNSGSTMSLDADKIVIGTTNTAADSLTFLSKGGSDYTVESGNFDLGITGQLNIDVSRNLSHIRNWADSDGDDLEISVKNLGITARNASLILCSEGTGTDAIKIDATGGGIDIDSIGLISIQTTDNINGIEIGNNSSVPITIGDGSSTTNLPGNLTVNGTTNLATITIDDNNIELNSITAPTDVNADGGGITIKGTTDKVIAYNNSSTACTAPSFQISEDVDLGTTSKQFTIQQNRALAHNALFINSTLNINSTDGGIYFNKQDSCSDTTGDWRMRVISGALITERYDGAAWIIKTRLTT